MLVRGTGLAASMSRYLIDRIEAMANIEVLTQTEIVALSGSPEAQLERVRWRHKPTGQETEKPIRNVFIFAGADPATNWLQRLRCRSWTDKQFVRTGSNGSATLAPPGGGSARPLPLELNVLGVFAVGDVRSGSVKRVGGAIGEGAAVVAQLHTVLGNAADCVALSREGGRRRSMPVFGIAKFERFFRASAGLDVDKEDLERYRDFINQKVYDLLLRGQAAAKANGRDIIEAFDLAVTRGLQECIYAFRTIDQTIELKPILDRLTALPPLDSPIATKPKPACPNSWAG